MLAVVADEGALRTHQYRAPHTEVPQALGRVGGARVRRAGLRNGHRDVATHRLGVRVDLPGGREGGEGEGRVGGREGGSRSFIDGSDNCLALNF